MAAVHQRAGGVLELRFDVGYPSVAGAGSDIRGWRGLEEKGWKICEVGSSVRMFRMGQGFRDG